MRYREEDCGTSDVLCMVHCSVLYSNKSVLNAERKRTTIRVEGRTYNCYEVLEVK